MPATRQTPTSTSHHLRVLLESGTVAGLSDGELLDRFTRERDEAAFTALIERHGPMVQRLCSDVMGNHHDAEDAFQATFLVLARHARSIRRPDSIASWLHGVAIRVSAAARSAAARRRTHERNRAALQVEQATVDEPGSDTLAAHVHAEVARLPDRFRGPVVLCYLEGRTYGEAAQLLQCPIGTIKSRLATARERLQRRLKQQPSAAAFAGIPRLGTTRQASHRGRADFPRRVDRRRRDEARRPNRGRAGGKHLRCHVRAEAQTGVSLRDGNRRARGYRICSQLRASRKPR